MISLSSASTGSFSPPLELVAHDGHLGLAVGLAQQEPAEAVGLELDREFEVVARHLFVVIGAVEPRGGVVGGPNAVEQRVEAGAEVIVVVPAALEHQMFEQVGGAGGAGDLVARADMIGDHEGEHRCRMIGQKQNLEAVGVEAKLVDGLERPDEGEPLDGARGGPGDLGGRGGAQRHERGENEEKGDDDPRAHDNWELPGRRDDGAKGRAMNQAACKDSSGQSKRDSGRLEHVEAGRQSGTGDEE